MGRRVIIIGSGPAGLTAAIYAARGGLEPTVIAGIQSGGQLMLTTEVENYPGFEEPVLGPELMVKMRRQAERFGVKVVDDDATAVEFSSRSLKVMTNDGVYEAEAVIIATGASALWLGLESEKRLIGRGVSSCATCDGFFFKGKDIAVVGGGDTAMEDALFLSNVTNRVTVIHRRNQLRASKIMQERAFANPKISFIWNSVIEEVLGSEKVEGVRIRNVKSGEVSTVPCEGVFVAIGYKPNTGLFRGQLETDGKGYIRRYRETETSVEGVFVAGDAYDFMYRQAVTAAASGCKAAIDAIKYLETKDSSSRPSISTSAL